MNTAVPAFQKLGPGMAMQEFPEIG